MGTDDSTSAIVAAIHWLVALVQGSVASSIAVIAIASVGLMMLSGRLELKRAVRVVLGCFLLFGVSVVAEGLAGAVHGDNAPAAHESAPPPYQAPSMPPLKAAPPSNYDPYAGAAYTPPK